MASSNQTQDTKLKSPEKLSGHDLVRYLIDNPDARGDFKYHTLRSCMWHNLLIAQPGFKDVADFDKIHHWDAFKIIDARPELSSCFDWDKLWPQECRMLLAKHPELADSRTTAHIPGYAWSEILAVQPQLAHLCSFEEIYPYLWVNLIAKQEIFADRCPWESFRTGDWLNLVERKKSCVKFLTLGYLDSETALQSILARCYCGKKQPPHGTFEEGVADAATFLICKRMDKENGKRYLKEQFTAENWDFVDEICDLSREEAMDVPGKKYMQFYITLKAPDNVFEKLFPLFDLDARDPGNNSLLMPALVYSLCSGSMKRYEFMLEQKLDPDEKNNAGFSCSDLTAWYKVYLEKQEAERLKAEAAKLEREARARERRKQKTTQAIKGKKYGR
ncbi:MAG: hypothetical protein J6S24_00845 [Lentisphaeria bacterium]|nr:hypothetical protein [Lentisphaeria bacterium]